MRAEPFGGSATSASRMTPFRPLTSLILGTGLLVACGDDSGAMSGSTSDADPTGGGSGTPTMSGSPSESETSGETSTSTVSSSGSTLGSSSQGAGTSGSTTDSSGQETASSETSSGVGEPIDLASYQPSEQVSIPAPADDASGATWNYDTDRVWVVQNGAGRFYEYAADDFTAPIRAVALAGINGNDTEGLAYLGGGEVAVAFEGGYGVYIADVPDGDENVSVVVKQTLTLAPPPPVGNNGLEGIAYDPRAEVFYAVGEGQDGAAPRRFFRFARPSVEQGDLDWRDPELTVDEPFIADRALPGSGASLDLAGIVFDDRDGNVLIISHTGSRVLQLDPSGDGTILGELILPPNQWEGIARVGDSGDLVLIAESNEMQRYSLPG